MKITYEQKQEMRKKLMEFLQALSSDWERAEFIKSIIGDQWKVLEYLFGELEQ